VITAAANPRAAPDQHLAKGHDDAPWPPVPLIDIPIGDTNYSSGERLGNRWGGRKDYADCQQQHDCA